MQDIEQALRIVTGNEQGDLREALAALDKALKDRAETLDRHLVHFLEQRSYVKALAFVVDGEVPE